MRRFARLSLAAGVPFGLAMGLLAWPYYGRRIALAAGVATAAAFGIAMATFVTVMASRRVRTPPLLVEGEALLKDGPANRFAGMEGVGGWLYLTDRRLFFRPHAFNIQTDDWSLSLSHVVAATATRTLGLVPNGLRIDTADGRHPFVVEGRGAWVEAIEGARRRVRDGG